MGRGVTIFLAELRRRRVFRTAAIYGAAAWLLIQIASDVFPALALPVWSVRLVVVMCLLGFPLALILSWSFDLTASGIARAEPAPVLTVSTSARPFWQGWSFWLALVGGVAIGVGALHGWRAYSVAHGERPVSIAVLPFEIFSADPADGFLAAGLHDEVLARLSQVSSMDVRSRTSVRDFAGDERPSIPEIARRLNVANIVEGSVQVVEGRVRIRVQLIEGASDRHLWANTYERPVEDIFRLQAEVAQEITSALHSSISPQDVAVLARSAPTTESEAYRLYLTALGMEQHAERIGARDDSGVIMVLEQAIRADPEFAVAHAALAERLSTWGMNSERQARALYHAMTAMRLAPNGADANRAMGALHFAQRQDELAARYLQQALRVSPSDVATLRYLAKLARRHGRWDESIGWFRRVMELEPTQPENAYELAQLLSSLNRYQEAVEVLDAALTSSPENVWANLWRAIIDFEFGGDRRRLLALAGSPAYRGLGKHLIDLNIAYTEPDRRRATELFRRVPRNPEYFPLLEIFLVQHLQLMGNHDEARLLYDDLRVSVSDWAAAEPQNEFRQSLLAIVYAGAGDREAAVQMLDRLSADVEAYGPYIAAPLRFRLAKGYALLGERTRSLEALEHMFAGPTSFSWQNLLIDPALVTLHDEPRFVALVERDKARRRAAWMQAQGDAGRT